MKINLYFHDDKRKRVSRIKLFKECFINTCSWEFKITFPTILLNFWVPISFSLIDEPASNPTITFPLIDLPKNIEAFPIPITFLVPIIAYLSLPFILFHVSISSLFLLLPPPFPSIDQWIVVSARNSTQKRKENYSHPFRYTTVCIIQNCKNGIKPLNQVTKFL